MERWGDLDMLMGRGCRCVEEGAVRVYDGLRYFLERTVGSKGTCCASQV